LFTAKTQSRQVIKSKGLGVGGRSQPGNGLVQALAGMDYVIHLAAYEATARAFGRHGSTRGLTRRERTGASAPTST